MSASALTSFTVQFNRLIPIPIFTFGLIGNVLNILVFTRPQLIKNPCSIYLFSSSITNINVLVFGSIGRFLSDGFQIDFSTTNLAYCRFRYFILHSSMVLSSWFIILAGIDRYWISSPNFQRRRLSNWKTACCLTIVMTLIGFGMYSHVLFLFTIEQRKSRPVCYAPTGTYQVAYDFFYFATFSFVPLIVMIIIGLGTFYNIQRTRTRVGPVLNSYRLRKRDRQLITMLLVQLIFTVILTLPITIQKIYSLFTQDVVKDLYHIAAENFVAHLARVLTHINSSIGFYL